MLKPSNICLPERYNQPQLIHLAHVCAILEAAPLKEGSAKELRLLHDTLNQHLRALKAMEHDCFETFITAAAELKFNQVAMCERQKFSCECESVPLYTALLKFLDVEARGPKNTVGGDECRRLVVTSGNKTIWRSYAVNIDDTCMGCKKANHPLYTFKMFQGLSHERKMGVVKFMLKLFRRRTFRERVSVWPEVQEMSPITSFVAAHGFQERGS